MAIDTLPAEEALLESKQQLLDILEILESITDPFLCVDDEWRVTYMNPKAEELMLGERQAIGGRKLWEVVPPQIAPALRLQCQKAKEEGAPAATELYCSPFKRWLDIQAYPNRRGVSVYFRDVSERKQMQTQLMQSQRLETAGRIASQVAHDFVNLLSPLAAYPDMIKALLPEGHPAVPYCDDILEAVERMAEINRDMLALGRRGVIETQPLHLNPLVEEALAHMPSLRDDTDVRTEMAPDLPLVDGSAAQLLRVFTNLISNAVEAMTEPGLLTVRTEGRVVGEDDGQALGVPPGSYALISVSDTGCGIPDDVRERIFDTFFTTKRSTSHRGSGLGLSIVQAIVEDHHGHIHVESELGKGTTFTVFLPARVQEAEGGERIS